MIWFSPHCKRPQDNLFAALEGDPTHRMTDAELAVLGEQDAAKEMAIERMQQR